MTLSSKPPESEASEAKVETFEPKVGASLLIVLAYLDQTKVETTTQTWTAREPGQQERLLYS